MIEIRVKEKTVYKKESQIIAIQGYKDKMNLVVCSKIRFLCSLHIYICYNREDLCIIIMSNLL